MNLQAEMQHAKSHSCFLLVLIRPPNLWGLRLWSCRSNEDPVGWLLLWKEKGCAGKQEVSSQPTQMLVGCLSSLWLNWRYMEKSLSYSTLASPWESGNRQREIQILGNQVKVAGVLDLWEALLSVTKAILVHLQGGKVALVSGSTCPRGQSVPMCANPPFTTEVFGCLDTWHM